MDAAHWSKAYNLAASEVEEFLFQDDDEDEAILSYRIRYASGKQIVALSSKPRNLRGRQGRVVLDEFAFHDNPDQLLRAAVALLMWGKSRIDVISSVGEEGDYFEKLCSEIAPERGYYVQTTTLDDALADGLYQRICLVNGLKWTIESERVWRDQLIKEYGLHALAELFCQPVSRVDNPLFNYFDQHRHVKPVELDPQLPLHMSFDFNRHPATAILANIRDDRVYVCEEFYLLNSDTFKLSKAVMERVVGLNPPRLFVYGDASGAAQTANSQQSNWAIVQDAIRNAGFMFTKRWTERNPPVIDTVNSVNWLFNTDRLFIHPRCKELILDLQKIEDDGKGNLNKKADLMRSHEIDCARYLCHTLYPYQSARAVSAGTAAPLKTIATRANRVR